MTFIEEVYYELEEKYPELKESYQKHMDMYRELLIAEKLYATGKK